MEGLCKGFKNMGSGIPKFDKGVQFGAGGKNHQQSYEEMH